jgi:hypothetical protein
VPAAGALQQIEMAARADAIGEQPRQIERGIESTQPHAQRRQRARHAAAVDHRHHRRRQPLGDLRRRPLFAVGRGAVVEPHDALDERDVGAGGSARERRQHGGAPHHPAVEVVADRAGGARVVGRIEVVGAALEGDDAQAAVAQGRRQRHRDRGLADAAGDPGDAQSGGHQ